jgi:hypothetical protein
MLGPRPTPAPRVPPGSPCLRCARSAPYVGPLDDYGTCPACAQAIREQVAASWPAIDRDCDQLGAFHRWCRARDDGRGHLAA